MIVSSKNCASDASALELAFAAAETPAAMPVTAVVATLAAILAARSSGLNGLDILAGGVRNTAVRQGVRCCGAVFSGDL